jgi:peptidoglycan hydrolase-like protein with peptidoglycan-binding domain
MAVEEIQRRSGPIQVDEDWFRIRLASLAERSPRNVLRQTSGSKNYTTLDQLPMPLMLECCDDMFHHNSAVLMPDHIPLEEPPLVERESLELEEDDDLKALDQFHSRMLVDPDTVDQSLAADERLAAFYVLATTLKFMEYNKSYKLLVAGHADTTGEDDYNYTLAQKRAEGVCYLLKGEREKWVDICEKQSRTEDYQRILLHYAMACAWSCDPGGIDGQSGPLTKRATMNFQKLYSEVCDKQLTVDGKVGPQTWGAFFDLYQAEIASVLGLKVDALEDYRSNLRFTDDDQPCVSFGEKRPIESMGQDNFYSSENRRVELLLFQEDALPKVSAGTPTDTCSAYGFAARFDTIIAVMRGSEPLSGVQEFEFGVYSVEPDDQEEQVELSFESAFPEEAWGFLDAFHYPGIGGAGELFDVQLDTEDR